MKKLNSLSEKKILEYILTSRKNVQKELKRQVPNILKRFEEFGLVEKNSKGHYRIIESSKNLEPSLPSCCDCDNCVGNCGTCPKSNIPRVGPAKKRNKNKPGHICGCIKKCKKGN
ncbi:PREDICTED: uncharacterized protein LOC105362598 [Ceratosolen solmsi marchali]|uniref:Uncharacterized protein LOC105362598 n=1 Tax=Ceratosolen solmsi marchali TaxID=326594 RepID=A0AAJ6YHX5_9HYME|nr:PREDICTED: uncharacterized protein LOC105362598 [Ceratosolen solmsi marchali]